MADIDIDLKTDFDPKKYFPEITIASRVQDNQLKKHNAGVYFQNIAKDHITGLAAIPYDQAEQQGYFKIDFLHLSILDYFDNKQQIRALLECDPDWELLQDQSVVEKLFQIHNHFDIVYTIKPRSVIELADCIALIRPGKRPLVDNYIKNKKQTRKLLYTHPDDNKYYFKKGHAISYALTIVLQLHLIKGKII